jgi:hypothetical protein
VLELINKLKTNWVLLTILVVAGIVRYWGIDFGLPNPVSRPDEQGVTQFTVGFFSGDLNPHNFYYGSFYYYILYIFFGLYYLLGLIGGKFNTTSDLFWEFKLNPTNLHLVNRYFSAFFGVATVFVTYKIATRFFDRKTGLISAFFLALVHLHVRDSHFGVTDVTNSFLIACSIFFIIKSYQDKHLTNYILAGIMAGLSTSTKYVGAMLFLPMAIVHIFNIMDEKNKGVHPADSGHANEHTESKTSKPTVHDYFPFKKLFFDKRIVSFATVLIFAFFLGTPFAILDFPQFSSDLELVFGTIKTTAKGHMVELHGTKYYINLGRGWWYHLRHTFLLGLGWSLYLSSIIGIVILIRKNPKKAAILFSFPLLYYVFSGKGYVVFLRYTITLIPFLCIGGALGIEFLSDRAAVFLKTPRKDAITSFLTILIILPSAHNVIRSNSLLTKKDNRLIAAEWINNNIPEGSSLYQAGLFWGRIWLHDNTVSLIKKVSYNANEEQKKALKVPMEYLKTNNVRGYNQWGYDAGRGRFFFNNQYQNALPQYIITRNSPLREYDMFANNIMSLLKTSYHLKKSFEVINVNNKENWFDRQDAFYLPFSGFEEIERPGPNIYIFERNL